jgi:hypothetical protein
MLPINPSKSKGYYIYLRVSHSEFLLFSHRVYVYDFYGPQNKQHQLIRFYKERESAYCAVRTESLSMVQVKFNL